MRKKSGKRGRMNMSNTFQSAESTGIDYRQAILLYWRYFKKTRNLEFEAMVALSTSIRDRVCIGPCCRTAKRFLTYKFNL